MWDVSSICGLETSARLKKSLIRLLKEDEEFRYTVAGLIGLGEVLKRFDKYDGVFSKLLKRMDKHYAEIARLREDMVKGFARHDELLAKHSEEITRLREDMVAGFKRHDEEISRLREDMVKGFARHDELLAKHSEEITRLREDMVKGFARHDELLVKHSEELVRLRGDMARGFDAVNRHISALGARWGLMAEEAFREGLRGVLERDFGVRVERWRGFDEEGSVYGHPSDVEVDVAVSDGKVLLIEVASHVRRSDISLFRRKAAFYERRGGRVPDRLVVVTPYADEDAFELASSLGIEVHTEV